MTPLNWAVLIVGLLAAVVVWWVSRKGQGANGEWIEPRANDKQLDMFNSTGQFDEFGVGKRRRVAPSLDGAPTASEAARGEAAAAAATVTERAQAQIEAERSQAMTTLRRDVSELALTLAGKVVGESLTDDARARASVDRFIADLENEAAKK